MTAGPTGGSLQRLGLQDPLLRNGYALVLNVGVATVLGVAFWLVAAQYYDAADVGRGSALVSALLLLSNFGQLGMVNGLIRFLPTAGRHTGRLLARTYLLCGFLAALLGLGFTFLAPWLSPELGFLHDDLFSALAFSGAVLVWAIFALQDAAIIGLRRAMWIPVENGSYGVLKLLLLVPLAAVAPGVGVFAAWVLAAAVLLVPVNIALFRAWVPRHVTATPPGAQPGHRLSGVLGFVTVDYVGQICFMLATSALPLLVVSVLGTESNGHFYIAWTIVVSLDLLAINLAQSLTVEASRQPERLPALLRRLLPRLAVLLGTAVVILFAGASLLLSFYGEGYVEEASTPLRMLAVALLARAVIVVTIAVARVQRRMWRILVIQASTATGVLGLSAVLAPQWGLRGVAGAWLLTQLVIALVLTPGLVRLVRTRDDLPGERETVSPGPVAGPKGSRSADPGGVGPA